jgi:hypothetical protein
VTASQRHPKGQLVSVHKPHGTQDFFQRLVDYGLTQTSLDRCSMAPVAALIRWVRTDIEAALLRTTAEKRTRNTTRLNLT